MEVLDLKTPVGLLLIIVHPLNYVCSSLGTLNYVASFKDKNLYKKIKTFRNSNPSITNSPLNKLKFTQRNNH